MDILYLQNAVGVAATPLDELLTKNLGLAPKVDVYRRHAA